MDRYQKIEKGGGGNLGEGTYGVVYKAKDRQTEEIVALKVRQRREGLSALRGGCVCFLWRCGVTGAALYSCERDLSFPAFKPSTFWRLCRC